VQMTVQNGNTHHQNLIHIHIRLFNIPEIQWVQYRMSVDNKMQIIIIMVYKYNNKSNMSQVYTR
jgi:hypothetical protein